MFDNRGEFVYVRDCIKEVGEMNIEVESKGHRIRVLIKEKNHCLITIQFVFGIAMFLDLIHTQNLQPTIKTGAKIAQETSRSTTNLLIIVARALINIYHRSLSHPKHPELIHWLRIFCEMW